MGKINLKEDFEFMIHISYERLCSMLLSLYGEKKLDSFYVEITPPFTACQTVGNGIVKVPKGLLCIKFSSANRTSSRLKDAEDLCKKLHEWVSKVTIKSGTKGYSVSSNLSILKEWDLDDGMC